MRDLVIRRCEPGYKSRAPRLLLPAGNGRNARSSVLSEQAWREELVRERDDNFALVASVHGEVVGHLAPRRLHEPKDLDTQDTSV